MFFGLNEGFKYNKIVILDVRKTNEQTKQN